MTKNKTFSVEYLNERLKSYSNVEYCSEEENDDGITEYTIVFSDTDGKFYKMEYKIDSTGERYLNPWKTQSTIVCVEVENKQKLRHCADGRSGVYFEIYEEDWAEVNED